MSKFQNVTDLLINLIVLSCGNIFWGVRTRARRQASLQNGSEVPCSAHNHESARERRKGQEGKQTFQGDRQDLVVGPVHDAVSQKNAPVLSRQGEYNFSKCTTGLAN